MCDFVEGLVLSLCSKDRDEDHAQHLVTTLLLVAITQPITFPPRLRRAIDTWTRQLISGSSPVAAQEGVACTLLHKMASQEGDKCTQHLLLHSVLSAADNNLLAAEPSLVLGPHARVHASGSPPFGWVHVCSYAGAGQHLEVMYDNLCALLLHLPSYRNAHAFVADSTCLFALHVWCCLLRQHPVSDAGFLSEALPALLALAAAKPGPIAQLAKRAVHLTTMEQIHPGYSALSALLVEFPLLRSPTAHQQGREADACRTVPVFFPEHDSWWNTFVQTDAHMFDLAVRGHEWLPQLQRAVLQHVFTAETDCPPQDLSHALSTATAEDLSKWCSFAIDIVLHGVRDSADADARLGVVLGNAVAGVSTSMAAGTLDTDASTLETPPETMDDFLGASSLQTALQRHAGRLPKLQHLAGRIFKQAITLRSSPSFSVATREGEGVEVLQLPGSGWLPLPNMMLAAHRVRSVADGSDRADSSQLQPSGPALVSAADALRMAAVEGAMVDCSGGTNAPSHACLLGGSPLAASAAQERTITAYARQRSASTDPESPLHSGCVDLPLVVCGDDATVSSALSGLVSAHHKNQQLFADMQPKVYVLPSQHAEASNRLAEFLAFIDPWYRRFAYAPLRGDCVTLPQLQSAGASPPASQPHEGMSPLSISSFFIQDFVRNSFKETKLCVWQVECWLPGSAASSAAKRQSRVAAMNKRQDTKKGTKDSSCDWSSGDAPFHPPERPADLLIPMFVYLELGMGVAAQKGMARGGKTWWAGVAQASAPGKALSTPELCIEATARRAGAASHSSTSTASMHCQGKRYLQVRLDNCPTVPDLDNLAAVSSMASSADFQHDEHDGVAKGPTSHHDVALGTGGDELQRMLGGTAYATEVGSRALPSDPWLNLSLVSDNQRAASVVQQAVRSMPTISNEVQAATGLGRKLSDAVMADEQRSIVNHISMLSQVASRGSTAAAAGTGLDLVVDGILYASDFTAIRVSPLALEDGSQQYQVSLMHAL